MNTSIVILTMPENSTRCSYIYDMMQEAGCKPVEWKDPITATWTCDESQLSVIPLAKLIERGVDNVSIQPLGYRPASAGNDQ